MRRSRWKRWLFVAVVTVIGLLFGLDVVTLQYLQSRGAAEMARTMAAEDATIDLGGFPFVPKYLSGSLATVSAHVTGASASRGLRVHSVDIEAQSVDFSPGELFALARSSFATRTDVTAEEALSRIELTEGDVNDFIRRQIPVVGDVQVKQSGIEVRFLVEGFDPAEGIRPGKDDLTKPARLIPAMRDRGFYLSLLGVSQIPPSFRAEAQRLEEIIELPRLPKGLSPQVRLGNEVIVIEAQGADVKVTVGEGEPG